MDNLEAFQNKELIAKLPKDGVHCYAGNPGKIMRNRIVSIIFFLLSGALAAFGFINAKNGVIMLALGGVGILLAVCFILSGFRSRLRRFRSCLCCFSCRLGRFRSCLFLDCFPGSVSLRCCMSRQGRSGLTPFRSSAITPTS